MKRQDFATAGTRGEFVFEGFKEKYAFDIPIGMSFPPIKDKFVIDCKSRDRRENIDKFMAKLRATISNNYLAVRVISFNYYKGEHDGKSGKKDIIYEMYMEGVWVSKAEVEKFRENAVGLPVMAVDEYFMSKGEEKKAYGYTGNDKGLIG